MQQVVGLAPKRLPLRLKYIPAASPLFSHARRALQQADQRRAANQHETNTCMLPCRETKFGHCTGTSLRHLRITQLHVPPSMPARHFLLTPFKPFHARLQHFTPPKSSLSLDPPADMPQQTARTRPTAKDSRCSAQQNYSLGYSAANSLELNIMLNTD